MVCYIFMHNKNTLYKSVVAPSCNFSQSVEGHVQKPVQLKHSSFFHTQFTQIDGLRRCQAVWSQQINLMPELFCNWITSFNESSSKGTCWTTPRHHGPRRTFQFQRFSSRLWSFQSRDALLSDWLGHIDIRSFSPLLKARQRLSRSQSRRRQQDLVFSPPFEIEKCLYAQPRDLHSHALHEEVTLKAFHLHQHESSLWVEARCVTKAIQFQVLSYLRSCTCNLFARFLTRPNRRMSKTSRSRKSDGKRSCQGFR